jgi:hypothetical protein
VGVCLIVHVSIVDSKFARFLSASEDATPEDLTSLVSSVDVGEKDGMAIIPARFAPCPEQCRRHSTKSDCGGGKLHRLDRNITEVTCLGIDVDKKPVAVVQAVLASLMQRGLMFWCWETHSHLTKCVCGVSGPHDTTKGQHEPGACVRILIPLETPCPIKRPSAWRDVAWPALVKHLRLWDVADKACSNPGRVYYTPRKPTEDAVRETDFHPGAPLDWQPILDGALEAYANMPDIVPAVQVEDETDDPVDLEEIRERLRAIKRPSHWLPLIKNVLAGRAPVPPPEKRTIDMPARDPAWLDVTNALATVREPNESKAACLEILRDSYVASVQDDPTEHQPWEAIVDQFERACDKMPSVRAEREADQEAKRQAQELALRALLRERLAIPANPPEGAQESPAHDVGGPTEPPEDWTDGLLFVQQKNGSQQVKNCSSNVAHFLRRCPEWRGVFRYNKVAQRIELHRGGEVKQFTDDVVAAVTDWFQTLPDDLAINTSDGIVLSRIRAVAYENAYDPLQDYLGALKWDGVPRLDGALETYFRAQVARSGDDISEYVRTVGRRWFLSAAARALEPGCKVDTVLILEGLRTGEKKTTGFSVLGGEFYTDQHVDIQNRDSWMVITQHWIVEFGELETFRKSEETARKTFLSQRVDKFRKPYGYEVLDYPRRCVFVGTTNKTDYLRDETGNRRYWPVESGEVDIAGLRRDRDQLWAEAVHLFKAGGKDVCEACAMDAEDRCKEHRWWLTRDESGIAEKQTEERAPSDAVHELLIEKLCAIPPSERPTELTITQILRLLEMDLSRGHEIRVGTVLRRARFTKARKLVNGIRTVFWQVPADVALAPHRPISSSIRVVNPKAPEAHA